MVRVGIGFDTHKLALGAELWLGGVLVPHSRGAVGHSDADVLIHAVIDALLGAAGLPDIGSQFPDTHAEYKNIESRILLERTLDLVRLKGYSIGNIDTTVVLQSPKISPFVAEIRDSLARILEITPDQISVKAKTSEKLGFIGREEGVSAYAVALLER
jgi:2-C-methyl-D-erythritol 2,4-cyclodiphosphate synthase